MSARARRHVRRPPDLTSLFDVLFIVVFVALIRAAAAQHDAAAAATPPPKPIAKPQPPQPPPDVAALRAKALAQVHTSLETLAPIVIRVSAAGTVEGIEVADQKLPLDIPLLEHSPDPDAALTYLGDRSAELRLCRIATVQLRLPDLSKHLVIVAPTSPIADLKRALSRGLFEDVERCLIEQRGIATILDATP